MAPAAFKRLKPASRSAGLDRMPAILRPEDYDRWLGVEPDPRELLRPFRAEPMMMWPVSTRVNTPKNDDQDILTPVVQADDKWPPAGNSA